MYIVTPFLGVRSIGRGLLNSFIILAIAFAIDCCFHSVDPRLYYYFIVYCLGVFTAKHYKSICEKILSSKYSSLVCVPYCTLLILIFNVDQKIYMLLGGYVGVFLILNLSMLLTEKIKHNARFIKILSFISYGSMCAYLFHREIYWLFLKLWSPQDSFCIWAYLFFIAFPVVICLSFYIQKLYDKIVK